MKKKFTIKIKPKQHHQSRMTSEELQEYLKMCKTGSSQTKNGKRYTRKQKHKKLRGESE